MCLSEEIVVEDDFIGVLLCHGKRSVMLGFNIYQ